MIRRGWLVFVVTVTFATKALSEPMPDRALVSNYYTAVALSDDGEEVAAARSNMAVRYWNLKSGKSRELDPPMPLPWKDIIRVICFSPDGSLLLVGDGAGALTLTSVDGNKIRHNWSGPGAMLAARFSPDGKEVWAARAQGTVEVRDVASGKILRQFHLPELAYTAFDFASNGEFVLFAGEQPRLTLWHLRQAKVIKNLTSEFPQVAKLHFSGDSQLALAVSEKGGVTVWDVTNGRVLGSVPEKVKLYTEEHTADAIFTPSARYMILSRGVVYEIASRRVVKRFEELTVRRANENIPALSLTLAQSANGSRVLSGGGAWLILWDSATGIVLHTLSGETGELNTFCGVTFSSDSKRLLSVDSASCVRVWDVSTGHLLDTYESPEGRYILGLPADEKLVLTLSAKRHSSSRGDLGTKYDLEVRNLVTAKVVHKLAEDCDYVSQASFSPDGKRILAAWYEGRKSKLWDSASGKILRTLNIGDLTAISPDNKWALSFSSPTTARSDFDLWDLERGVKSQNCKVKMPVFTARWSPGGQVLVNGHNLQLCDLHSERKFITYEAAHPIERFGAAAFSPHKDLVVAGTSDQTLAIWKATTGKRLKTCLGRTPSDTSECISISPDGKWIASGGNHSLKLWDLQTGRELRAFVPPMRNARATNEEPGSLAPTK